MSSDLDLFGMPIPEGRGKRGRPVHMVTLENRNKVNMLLAFKWTDERIANALGISTKTLWKYYFHELKRRLIARDMLDAKRIERLWELGMEGQVSALKEHARLLEKNDAANASASFLGDDEEPEEKPQKLGKKEAAAIAAEAVEQSDSWGGDLAFRGRQLN